MTSLRVYYKILGGHVHCRVFSGKAPDLTHGKNGDLTFSVEEWGGDGVYNALSRIADVREEAP